VNEPTPESGPVLVLGGLELRLSRPLTTDAVDYALEGRLTGGGAEQFWDGGSLLICNGQTGLADEVYFAANGNFTRRLTVQPDSDVSLVLALCDDSGEVVATAPATLRHRRAAGSLPPDASLLPRDLTVEVLTRSGQRRRQMLAPAGALLPGKFQCQARTTDQCGRVVVPLWDGDRLLHQVVVEDIDRRVPPGCPVDLEVQIEPDCSMTVRVLVKQAGRGEVVQLPAPAPSRRPTDAEVDCVARGLDAALASFSGQYAARLREHAAALRTGLDAALANHRDAAAAEALDGLDILRQQLELAPLQIAFPPPQRLTQLVKRCLFEAAELADRTGRDREHLFGQIYAQEQAAEEAHAERHVAAYRESFANLRALADDLERLHVETGSPGRRGGRAPTAFDVADAARDLQAYLAAVRPMAERKGRADLLERLRAVEQTGQALAERGKSDPQAALRDARRALAEVAAVEQALAGAVGPALAPAEGMLEGSP
jgi:hypothetical protein